MALLFFLTFSFFSTAAGQEDFCDAGVKAGNFPGVMVVEIKKLKIGIGSVAPFPGGAGYIRAQAGPLIEGAATLTVKPEDFKIEPFFFPYFLSWKTDLKARASGRGEVRLSPSGQHASLSFQIPLEAANWLGSVYFAADFTTGMSQPAEIAGVVYRPAGGQLDFKNGMASIVATAKTSPESSGPFRNVDLYVHADVCIGFSR